jgi:hypothetical protein
VSEGTTRGALDAKIASAAARDLPLAAAILREAIRIPADHVDRPPGAPAGSGSGAARGPPPAAAIPRKRLLGGASGGRIAAGAVRRGAIGAC